MRCPQCGKEIADSSAKQCPSCGMRLTDEELPDDHQPDADMEPGHAPLAPAPSAGVVYPQHEVPAAEAASVPTGGAPYPPTSVALPAQLVGKGRIALIITLTVIAVLLIGGGSAAAIFTVSQRAGAIVAGPTATATATPTPTQTSYLIYQNALTTKSAGWIDDTRCGFKADGYHVFESYVFFAPTGPLVNVDVSVDVQQIGGASNQAYGVSFRYPTPTSGTYANHYVFGIDSLDRWVVWKEVNQQAVRLAGYTPNAAIHTGLNATNRLRARTNGQQFDFFINGTLVGHVDDSRFAGGYVATVGNVGVVGCSGCNVVFTNISIADVGQ